MSNNLSLAVQDVLEERAYQDRKWGHEFDDTHSPYEWAGFINQYATKSLVKYPNRKTDWRSFRADMIKVAALALAAAEAYDRTTTIAA